MQGARQSAVIRTLARVALLTLAFATAGARADERILAWQSDIRVRPDSTLEVRETLRVRAEGTRIRRGIFRDFPTGVHEQPRRARGHRLRRAGRDTRRAGGALSRREAPNGVRVWIGDADVELHPGEHTYTIAYAERPPARASSRITTSSTGTSPATAGIFRSTRSTRRCCFRRGCRPTRSGSRRTPGRRARRAASGRPASTPAQPPFAPPAAWHRARASPSSRAGPRVT